MIIFLKNYVLYTRPIDNMSPAVADFIITAAGITTHSTPGGDGDVTKREPKE